MAPNIAAEDAGGRLNKILAMCEAAGWYSRLAVMSSPKPGVEVVHSKMPRIPVRGILRPELQAVFVAASTNVFKPRAAEPSL